MFPRWEEAVGRLRDTEVYQLTTVGRDGRSHVTPLLGVWLDDALHVCTGPGEQKEVNLRDNRQCAMAAGDGRPAGLLVVVEGEAERVLDDRRLKRLAEAWESKYGEFWRFDAYDGAFHGGDGRPAYVFEVAPKTAFGFVKGGEYAQTRWSF